MSAVSNKHYIHLTKLNLVYYHHLYTNGSDHKNKSPKTSVAACNLKMNIVAFYLNFEGFRRHFLPFYIH